MMRVNGILDNEFQLHENNNISSEGANNIQGSNIKTDGLSSLYTLENTEYLQQNIENIAKYLKPYISKMLKKVLQINSDNVKIICDYIIAEQNELNIKESTKETKIKKLVHLSAYFHHKKTFFEMTKEDLLSYPNSLRKPSSIDPTHKSIGTWNARQMLFLKFFRWLYNLMNLI